MREPRPPDSFQKLIASIDNFSSAQKWSKQRKIALMVWYVGLFAPGFAEKKGLCRMVAHYVEVQRVDLGLTEADINGGKLFAELTSGNKKPMLEKVAPGSYRTTAYANLQFRDYRPLVQKFEDERWERVRARVEARSRSAGVNLDALGEDAIRALISSAKAELKRRKGG